MAPITLTDQLGDTITCNFPPQRIVSLVPSQTELLFDLGLKEQIVGITRYCLHPTGKVDAIEKIGGTKRFDIDKIKALNPDLIIGNKEENYREGIEELKQHFPVWMSDIYTLNDAYDMMEAVAHLTDRSNEGAALVKKIKEEFKNLENFEGARTAYFIWRKPYMVAANNTFIHYLLSHLGLVNVFESKNRYPEITPEELAALKPDFIFLSSEPYSFTEKHYEEFKSFCPAGKVILVDGEMFSWYGSRLQHAPAYFEKLRKELAAYF